MYVALYYFIVIIVNLILKLLFEGDIMVMTLFDEDCLLNALKINISAYVKNIKSGES